MTEQGPAPLAPDELVALGRRWSQTQLVDVQTVRQVWDDIERLLTTVAALTARAEGVEAELARWRSPACTVALGIAAATVQADRATAASMQTARDQAQREWMAMRTERDAARVTAGLADAARQEAAALRAALEAIRDAINLLPDEAAVERCYRLADAALAEGRPALAPPSEGEAAALRATLAIAETRLDGLRATLERVHFYVRTGHPEAVENIIEVAFETDNRASFAQMAAAGGPDG